MMKQEWGDFLLGLEEKALPILTHQLIKSMEDFLVFARDSDVKKYTPLLIDFFVTSLKQEYGQSQLVDTDASGILCALLHAIRYIRADHITLESVKRLDSCCFDIVKGSNGCARRYALVALLDRCCMIRFIDCELGVSLLSWIIAYVGEASKDVLAADHTMLVTMIYSLRVLFKSVDAERRRTLTGTGLNAFLELSVECLKQRSSPVFFPDLELIVAKSLRIGSFMIDPNVPLPERTIELVTKAFELIPDEPEFVYIIQNKWMFLCTFIDKGRQEEIYKMTQRHIGYILHNIPLFMNVPLSKSKRVLTFIQVLLNWMERQRTSCANDAEREKRLIYTIQSCLPLISNIHGHIFVVKYVADVVYRFMNAEVFARHPTLHIDVMIQMIGGLELLRSDADALENGDRTGPVDPELWMEMHVQILRIIKQCASTGSHSIDHMAMTFIEIFVKLTDHMVYLLDLVDQVSNGSVPLIDRGALIFKRPIQGSFAERIKPVIDYYCASIAAMPDIVTSSVLSICMIKLMPTQPYHRLHFILHQMMLTKVRRVVYHTAFFDTVTAKFEEIFTPACYCSKLVKLVFIDAYATEDLAKRRSDYLHRFVLLGLSMRVSSIVELVWSVILEIYFKDARLQKLSELASMLGTDPFSISEVMKLMLDDPVTDDTVSLLAIVLSVFPFAPAGLKPKIVNPWISLVLPAIENGSRTTWSVLSLYFVVAHGWNFPVVMSHVDTSARGRLLAALAGVLRSPVQKDVGYARSVLEKSPEMTLTQMRSVHVPENDEHYIVRVDDMNLSISVLFDAVKSKKDSTDKQIECFAEIFVQFMKDSSLNVLALSNIVWKIAEFLAGKDVDIVNYLHERLEAPGKYAALVMRHRYGLSIRHIVDEMDDALDFAEYMTVASLNACAFRVSMDVFGYLLPKIPTSPLLLRVNVNLINMAQYEPDLVEEIYKEFLYVKCFEWENPDVRKVRGELLRQFMILCSTGMSIRQVTKIAIKSIRALTDPSRPDMKGYSENLQEGRVKVALDIAGCIERNGVDPWVKLVFAYPVNDVPDPLVQVEKLIKLFTSKFRGCSVSVESDFMHKKFGKGQKATDYATARFLLKAIANLLAVVTPCKEVARVWESMVVALREPRARGFIPYFVHLLEKASPKTGIIMGELSSLFTPNGLPSIDDMILAKYVIKNCQKIGPVHLSWLKNVMMEAQRAFKPGGTVNDITIISGWIIECFNIFCTFTSVDEMEVRRMLEFLAVGGKMVPRVDIQIDLFTERYAEWILSWARSVIERTFNRDVVTMIASWIVRPKCVKLRDSLFREFEPTSKFCEYITAEAHSNACDFLISQSFTCMRQIYSGLEVSQINIPRFFKGIYLLYHACVKVGRLTALMKPVTCLAAIEILAPLKFANVLNTDTAAYDAYKTVISHVTRRLAILFLHPLFIPRFTRLMGLLDEDKRCGIYEELTRVKDESSHTFAKIVNGLMAYASCKAHGYAPYNQVQSDAIPAKDETLFESYMMTYISSVASLVPDVTIDLGDCQGADILAHRHAAAIHKGHKTINGVRTLSRLLNIITLLSKIEGVDRTGWNDKLLSLMKESPFGLRQALTVFKRMSEDNQLFDMKDPRIMKLCLAVLNIGSNVEHKQNVFQCVSPAFKALHHDDVVYAAPAVIDRLTGLITLGLQKWTVEAGRNVMMAVWPIPTVLRLYAPLVKPTDVCAMITGRLRDAMTNTQGIDPKLNNHVRTRVVLQLINCLAPILFHAPFLPPELLPLSFFSSPTGKDYQVMYRDAVRKAISVDKGVVTAIMKNVYEQDKDKRMNRYTKLSRPMDSFFPTICKWVDEAQEDPILLPVLKILLDVFKPIEADDLIANLHSLRGHRLHSHVSTFISTLLNDVDLSSGKARYIDRLLTLPATDRFGYLRDVVNDIWCVDWFGIPEQLHTLIFVKILLPERIQFVVQTVTVDGLGSLVNDILQNSYQILDKFINFYAGAFPDSQLTEAMALTPVFAHAYPFKGSVQSIVTKLDAMNLCDEALGVLQTECPGLSMAIAFHQLGQFRAAKSYYLRAMDSDPGIYFHGLDRMRICSINLSLIEPLIHELPSMMFKVADGSPQVTLPFVQDTIGFFDVKPQQLRQHDPNNLLSTFVSPGYIPHFANFVLFDQVLQVLRVQQCLNGNRALSNEHSNTIRAVLSNTAPACFLKSLDKRMMMASMLAWKIGMFSQLATAVDPQIGVHSTKIRGSVIADRVSLAAMLAKTGSLKAALRICQNTAQEPPSLSFMRSQIPRALRFLLRTNGFRGMETRVFISLSNFGAAIERYEREPTTALWLRIVIEVCNYDGRMLDTEKTMMKAIKELSVCDPKHYHWIICLIMKLITRNNTLQKFLSQAVAESKDELKKAWIRWLPIVFKKCSSPPLDFLVSLMSVNPMHFLLNMRQLGGSVLSTKFFEDLYGALRAAKLEHHKIEFDRVFGFMKERRQDMERLSDRVHVLKQLYGSLRTDGEPEVPKCLADRFSSFAELIEFCEENPPVFTSSVTITGCNCIENFDFPGMPSRVFRVILEADGRREARLRIISDVGTSKSFALVSSDIFGFTVSGRLFCESMAKSLQRHPGTSIHTDSLYYPDVFMLDRGLFLVDCPPFTTMHEIGQPYHHFAKIIENKRMVDETQPLSPGANRKVQQTTTPDDLLFRWFVRGAHRNVSDFLFMRQSMAAHFGAAMSVATIFACVPQQFPSCLFFDDRRRILIPRFTDLSGRLSVTLPLTKNVRTLFPSWVLRGSFQCSWHAVAATVFKNRSRVRLLLSTILDFKPIPVDTVTEAQARQTEAQSRQNEAFISIFTSRCAKLTCDMSEDTEKVDHVFPFLVFNHLINTSGDANDAQGSRWTWI